MLLETSINDAITMFWPLAVLANDDAEFNAAWTALQSAVEMAGIRRMEEIRIENYLRNSGR
jgi:hypothetical protein